MTDTCENCGCWRRAELSDDLGECRRFPPTIPNNMGGADFAPATSADFWCWEHKPIKPRTPLAAKDPFFAAHLYGRPGDDVLEYEDAHLIVDEDALWLTPVPVVNDRGEQRWAVMIPISEDGDSDYDWFTSAEEAQRVCDEWPRAEPEEFAAGHEAVP